AVRDHARRHGAAARGRAAVEPAMKPRLERRSRENQDDGRERVALEPWLINGALIAVAVIAVFPLAWMVSVSVMAPGEASAFPPPVLPASPTLDSYRELFARGHIGRNLLNSVGLAIASTILSLAFNVTAGYAFAKLRFAGRDLTWKLLLGVMLVPAQVAMIPLF